MKLIKCSNYNDSRDYKNFSNDFLKIFSLELNLNESEFKTESIEILNRKMYEYVFNCYRSKIKQIKEDSFPVVNSIYLDESNNYKNIIIPFSDGVIGLNVISNLEESHNTNGESIIKDFERCIVLSIIDRYWKEHLREMDDLRQSVQGAVYEQKDPLLIYKFESLDLYKKMQNKIDLDIISFLFKAQLPSRNKQNISEAKLQTQFGKAERGQELKINNSQKNNFKY